ncbi:MAG TPA: PQQ-binding-like beta-propeller repeat protein [Steroidobacteraceae bacterium]
MQAVDAQTGSALYALAFNHWPFFSSPSLAGNFLYIGSEQGKLLAIDVSAQRLAWAFRTEDSKKNGPMYTNSDGTPNYRAAQSDSFYDQLVIAHDRLLSVGAVLSTPVVDGDTVYFGSWDGQLYAIG